jgi:hypothetical protein
MQSGFISHATFLSVGVSITPEKSDYRKLAFCSLARMAPWDGEQL